MPFLWPFTKWYVDWFHYYFPRTLYAVNSDALSHALQLVSSFVLFLVLLGLSHAEEMDAILRVDMEQQDREDYITQDIHGLPINEFRFKSASELASSECPIATPLIHYVSYFYLINCLTNYRHSSRDVHGQCNLRDIRREQLLSVIRSDPKSIGTLAVTSLANR